jgi:hypothetical protein
MKKLSDTVSSLRTKIQLTNILLCLIYVGLLSVLYLDLYVWRPN